MAQAKIGDTVSVHYTGKLKDGSVFDTSRDRDPLQFKIGEGEIIPGFEKAVIGMEVEDTKTIKIPSDEAYGPHREDLVLVIDRSDLPDEVPAKVSTQVKLRLPNNKATLATITQVTTEKITLDANHPLAGMDLTFSIELMEIA
jgi:peptidylprolyl isomerase